MLSPAISLLPVVAPPDIERIAEKFGVPVALLVCGIVLAVITARWLAKHVASPLVERHIAFLDRTEGLAQSTSRLIDRQTEATNDIATAIRGIEANASETRRLIGEMLALQQRLCSLRESESMEISLAIESMKDDREKSVEHIGMLIDAQRETNRLIEQELRELKRTMGKC